MVEMMMLIIDMKKDDTIGFTEKNKHFIVKRDE